MSITRRMRVDGVLCHARGTIRLDHRERDALLTPMRCAATRSEGDRSMTFIAGVLNPVSYIAQQDCDIIHE